MVDNSNLYTATNVITYIISFKRKTTSINQETLKTLNSCVQ